MKITIDNTHNNTKVIKLCADITKELQKPLEQRNQNLIDTSMGNLITECALNRIGFEFNIDISDSLEITKLNH